MGKKKNDGSWNYGGAKRRDFQHTHDGPEIMPHKKKSNKPSRKRSRCDHDYKVVDERVWFYPNGHGHRQVYLRCKKCDKKKFELTYTDEQW